ncbi:MAG: DUF496 family protein [Fusobacterium sp.]
MDNALELVRKARRKIKLKEKLRNKENENVKKRVTLNNLEEYVKPTMCYDDFMAIVENRKLTTKE